MKHLFISAFFLVSACACLADATRLTAVTVPPLPLPVSNNAAVSLRSNDNDYLVSFAGLGAGRSHADTLAATYVFDGKTNRWSEAAAVPGGVGRLAAVAAAAGGLAYVFGGYTVAENGEETSTPWVHAFDPIAGTFEQRQSMPVPVDDAVAVVYENRFIYLISGWHDLGNVNLVQRYDTIEDSWVQATPIPGRGVFGHAGGIVGDTIVYCDGVAIAPHADRRRDFVANDECFSGLIDPDNSRRIDWRSVEAHPGPPRYRMAAAGSDTLDAVLFIGGSDNPYNFNGIGYNGEPSQPRANMLRYDIVDQSWTSVSTEFGSMDHRALLRFRDAWITLGGMLENQRVTDRVIVHAYD
jgi:hypothetical protein